MASSHKLKNCKLKKTKVVDSWGLASLDGFFACSMAYLFRPTLRLRRVLAPLQAQVLDTFVLDTKRNL